MKEFFLVLAAAFCSLVSSAQNNYSVHGKISGKADGYKVYLQTMEYPHPRISDSTVIKKGQFVFKGRVDVPVMCQIIIDRTPKGEPANQSKWSMSSFYLENSDIHFSGAIKTLPHFYWRRDTTVRQPTITGSATQDEYAKYNAGMADLTKQLNKADEEYLKVYHIPALDGKFNTKEGIAIARREDSLRTIADETSMKYIEQHSGSVVAYDMAMQKMDDMSPSLTIQQIDDLVGTIKKGWEGTPNMSAFEKLAETAKKTAVGVKYQDFEFTTPEGEKVMLSRYVPEGKMVMIEFWASWCGPCRGEIPHLKHLNETKSDVFSIVSISLDEKDADWKKAMKDEGMVWTQLSDPHGFEGEIAKAYNITGIPQSLMLDKEGRIMKIGLRGAFLDLYLEKIGNINK